MSRAVVGKILLLALLASTLSGAAPQSASADPVLSAQDRADDSLLVFYYRNPQPDQLAAFLRRMQISVLNWEAYPPLAGFLAVRFQADPQAITSLTPNTLTPKMADAFKAAIRLSGRTDIPSAIRDLIASAGSDPTLSKEFANLPNRLDDLHIVTPTHLDILWGAFFAGGSAQYVEMILNFFAQISNKSEIIAVDITKLTLAAFGGPRPIYGELREKYGNFGYAMVFASTAEWGLLSNGLKHPIVRKVVNDYISANPTSYAAQSLTGFLKIIDKRK